MKNRVFRFLIMLAVCDFGVASKMYNQNTDLPKTHSDYRIWIKPNHGEGIYGQFSSYSDSAIVVGSKNFSGFRSEVVYTHYHHRNLSSIQIRKKNRSFYGICIGLVGGIAAGLIVGKVIVNNGQCSSPQAAPGCSLGASFGSLAGGLVLGPVVGGIIGARKKRVFDRENGPDWESAKSSLSKIKLY